MRPRGKRHPGGRARRGAVLIVAVWALVIVTALVLVMARDTRVEAIGAANRLSQTQASAVEQGAEQFVLATIEANRGDAQTITSTPAEGLSVGNGYFWILRPDPYDYQNYGFGICDESSKLNLNFATSDQMLALPSFTSDMADSVVDWRDPDDTLSPNGAENSYYESLPIPYTCKNQPFETVEELLLVKGFDRQALFGYDMNRDGVLDAGELAAGGGGNAASTAFNSSADDGRGAFNYMTVYSIEPNVDSTGNARININAQTGTAGQLRNVLAKAISSTWADAIMAAAGYNGRGGPPKFPNVLAFYAASGMTADEFGKVYDKLTTSAVKTLPGLINVNTAPRQVLLTLPGLASADVDSILSKRSSASGGVSGGLGGSGSLGLGNIGSTGGSNSLAGSTASATASASSNLTWLFQALTPQKLLPIGGAITTRSYQYSADIVALAGDGRSFKRVRIVVDSQQLPAKIVYRKDLTGAGFPLPADVRDQLRAGNAPAQISLNGPTAQGSESSSSGFSGLK